MVKETILGAFIVAAMVIALEGMQRLDSQLHPSMIVSSSDFGLMPPIGPGNTVHDRMEETRRFKRAPGQFEDWKFEHVPTITIRKHVFLDCPDPDNLYPWPYPAGQYPWPQEPCLKI